MTLEDIDPTKLKEYKEALILLLERYEDNVKIHCPLCKIPRKTMYGPNCQECIWAVYYTSSHEICSSVYLEKSIRYFKGFNYLEGQLKEDRIKEIKQWIKDIEEVL